MKFFSNILNIFIAFLSYTKCDEDLDITKFMKHFEVIPDVIDEGPEDYLKVVYENNVQADKGVELTPTQVKNQPKVEWKGEKDSYYTLIMTDPDPSIQEDPKVREWQHWLVVNIPGNNLNEGETLSEYVGAGAPQGTGLHRYVFLLFKQSGKLEFDEPKLTNKSVEKRGKYSTKEFIEKYKLKRPIAGNFFQAQWDDYVPTLHAQLGF